jgi:hypothetical protein
MKPPLRTANAAQDIQFETGRSFPIAFFVWDGSKWGDRRQDGADFLVLLSSWSRCFPRQSMSIRPWQWLLQGGLQWWAIRRLRRGKRAIKMACMGLT